MEESFFKSGGASTFLNPAAPFARIAARRFSVSEREGGGGGRDSFDDGGRVEEDDDDGDLRGGGGGGAIDLGEV